MNEPQNPRGSSDNDCFYVWQVLGLPFQESIYKIGVSSNRLGQDRIHHVARVMGLSAGRVRTFHVMNAYDLESWALSHGEVLPRYVGGFDGATEMRILTAAQYGKIIGVATTAEMEREEFVAVNSEAALAEAAVEAEARAEATAVAAAEAEARAERERDETEYWAPYIAIEKAANLSIVTVMSARRTAIQHETCSAEFRGDLHPKCLPFFLLIAVVLTGIAVATGTVKARFSWGIPAIGFWVLFAKGSFQKFRHSRDIEIAREVWLAALSNMKKTVAILEAYPVYPEGELESAEICRRYRTQTCLIHAANKARTLRFAAEEVTKIAASSSTR